MNEVFFKRLLRRIPLLREPFLIRDSLDRLEKSLSSLQRQFASAHAFDVSRVLDFDLPKHPRYGDPKRLFTTAFQASSQNGEDGMIHEIFRRVGTTNRTFVEIGVGDGTENNTAFLRCQGWRGYWIDGATDFLKVAAGDGDLLKAISGFVTGENVGRLLTDAGVPEEFDFLSIDVDQNTYYVWEGMSAFKPRVVVIEYNAAFPPDIEWVVRPDSQKMWDGSQNFGASLKALEKLGTRRGYKLVGCDFTGINAFFVREDLCSDEFLSPFTAENHYEPVRYGALCRRGHPANGFDRMNETNGATRRD